MKKKIKKDYSLKERFSWCVQVTSKYIISDEIKGRKIDSATIELGYKEFIIQEREINPEIEKIVTLEKFTAEVMSKRNKFFENCSI